MELHFREFVDTGWSVVSLYLQGDKLQEIAEKMGKSTAWVYKTLKTNGIKPNRLKQNHGNVHFFSAEGHRKEDIAKLTGYSRRHIDNILG